MRHVVWVSALAWALLPALTSAQSATTAPDAAANPGPAAESAAESTDAAATRILVIPYQAVFRSAKQRQVDKATEYLTQELGKKASIEVLRAGAPVEGAEQASMEPVNALLEQAKEAEADHRIQDAIELRQKVLDQMETNASALPDADAFIMAHHHLARALMWAAEDDRARTLIDAAARMDPNRDLPASEFSRLYRSWFESRRKELRRERRAQLLVRSVLPGATISIDGRETDVAPVKLVQVLPGKHLISATVGEDETSRAVVTVKAGEEKETTVAFGETIGGPAIGSVADALAENELPASAVSAAQRAGQTAEADFVVLGGLAKETDHFNVHTYVMKVGSGKLAPVNVTQFDLALLTAESDVLRVVLGVEEAIEQFDGSLASVAMLERQMRPATVVNEVDGAPDLSRRRKRRAEPKERGQRTVVKATDDLDIED